MFNSWFNPSRYKAFSFKTQKFSLRFKSVLVSSAVVCFLICSFKVNSACCWKLWFGSSKYLHAQIETCDLVYSYDYWGGCWKESHFFQRIEVGIYGIEVDKLGFHFSMLGFKIFERSILSCNLGMFLFASLVYNKDCSVLRGTVSNVLIVQLFGVFKYNFVFKDAIASELLIQVAISPISNEWSLIKNYIHPRFNGGVHFICFRL